jgi:hypothetical protein
VTTIGFKAGDSQTTEAASLLIRRGPKSGQHHRGDAKMVAGSWNQDDSDILKKCRGRKVEKKKKSEKEKSARTREGKETKSKENRRIREVVVLG